MKRGPRGVLDSFLSREIAMEWLSFELLENGKFSTDMARMLGISKQEISRYCEEAKIDLRERTARWYAKKWGIPELETAYWLIQQKRQDENMGIGNLAGKLSLSPYIFGQQLERLGFDREDFKKKRKFVFVRCTNCEALIKKEFNRIKNNKYFFCNNHCFGQWGGENFGFGKGKKPRLDEEDQFIQEN